MEIDLTVIDAQIASYDKQEQEFLAMANQAQGARLALEWLKKQLKGSVLKISEADAAQENS